MTKKRLISLPEGEYLYRSVIDSQTVYSVDSATDKRIKELTTEFGNNQSLVPTNHVVKIYTLDIVNEDDLTVEYGRIGTGTVSVCVCNIKSQIVGAF